MIVIHALTRNQNLLFCFKIKKIIEKSIIIKCYLKQLNINVYAGRLVLLTKEFEIPVENQSEAVNQQTTDLI